MSTGFWGTQGLNTKCQVQKWKAGRADAAQKVGGAMPRGRAWLRPWRSAWTRAAAAGGVWGHEQMSFTTSNAGLLLFCPESVHFKNCQVPLKLWHATWEPTGKKKKNRIIKPFQIWKCFLGWLDVMPIKEAAWLSVLSLLRDSLYIIHLFNSVRRLLHVKAVIVICLGGNILAHGGASKPSFQSLDCCGRTEILLRSFYQLTSDLGKLVLSECKLKKIWP